MCLIYRCATNNLDKIQDNSLNGFYKVTFFKDKNIKIKRICLNNCSNCVFWITDSGIYAHGSNDNFQFGIKDDNQHKPTPVLIEALQDVIDIQSNKSFAVALCSNNWSNIRYIIKYWTNNTNHQLPVDIIRIIVKYYNINKVLSCGKTPYGGHGHGETTEIKEWTEIDALKDKDIQKIRIGAGNSYFLDSQGVVFVCGKNGYGQLGLGHFQRSVFDITPIDYFIKNDIRIQDMESGDDHVIMMDYNNRIYTFGGNHFAQIGDGTLKHVNEPKEIIMFRDLKVVRLISGTYHIIVKCEGDEYYGWGDNAYNQSMVGADLDTAKTPQLLDLKDLDIYDVALGYDSTAFILSMH